MSLDGMSAVHAEPTFAGEEVGRRLSEPALRALATLRRHSRGTGPDARVHQEPVQLLRPIQGGPPWGSTRITRHLYR
jgi:hypothetical protein